MVCNGHNVGSRYADAALYCTMVFVTCCMPFIWGFVQTVLLQIQPQPPSPLVLLTPAPPPTRPECPHLSILHSIPLHSTSLPASSSNSIPTSITTPNLFLSLAFLVVQPRSPVVPHLTIGTSTSSVHHQLVHPWLVDIDAVVDAHIVIFVPGLTVGMILWWGRKHASCRAHGRVRRNRRAAESRRVGIEVGLIWWRSGGAGQEVMAGLAFSFSLVPRYFG